MSVVPCGECFTWAWIEAVKDRNLTLIHAIVHDPWDRHSYWHAWVEDTDRVYDWQTMAVGMSKYAKSGWPIVAFYDAYSPVNIEEYDGYEAIENRELYGHCGPWKQK